MGRVGKGESGQSHRKPSSTDGLLRMLPHLLGVFSMSIGERSDEVKSTEKWRIRSAQVYVLHHKFQLFENCR